MPDTALHLLTISDAAALISARQLSPVEYVQAQLERISALDPQLNAFITLTAEHALAQARTAENEITAGHYRGPLHGIPFGLKDIIDTAGILTSGHSRVCINNIPEGNATVTQRLLDAGGVLMGKLSTHEFASGGPSLDLPWPPARNPWNTAHFTGGSSSGPGAAVAAGLLPGAIGTDTGGSIRIPAALCGVAGLKPTYGRVSRYGIMPCAFTFDHAGPLAWTVEDCAIMLQAIAGHDPRDPSSARRPVPDYRAALSPDIRGLRIGVVRHFWEEEGPTDPEMARAMDEAIEVLRRMGAKIDNARMRTRRNYHDTKMVIGKTETATAHAHILRERPHDYGADFLGRNLPGFLFSGTDYVRAQRERRIMVDEMAPLYERFDVLLTATGAPAARLDRLIGTGFTQKWQHADIYTPFSVAAGPVLVVCNGYTKSGLPLGMQIAGRPFAEETVLRIGHAYEKATPWRERHPTLVPGATAPALTEPPPEAIAIENIPADIRATVESAILRAGLKLDDRQRAQMYQVAPLVLDAARRVRNDHQYPDEPANIFRFPDSDAS